MVESGTARPGGGGAAGKGGTAAEESNHFIKQLSENAPVYVQRPGTGTESVRHTGILIGNLKDQLLVIGIFDGAEFAIDERLVVRMALGAHLVGFEAQVVKKLDDPPLYLIRFPQRIEAINLRKAQRLQAFFPADVQLAKGGSGDIHMLKTRVTDISAGGCSFRSKTKLPGAAAVQISFALPADRHIHSVKATVIECAQVGFVFHTRAKFLQEPSNLPALQEVAKWVAEGLSFTKD